MRFMERCPHCPGRMQEAKLRMKIAEVDIGSFDGVRCNRCGAEFLEEESSIEIEKIAKEKGLFGRNKLPVKCEGLPIRH